MNFFEREQERRAETLDRLDDLQQIRDCLDRARVSLGRLTDLNNDPGRDQGEINIALGHSISELAHAVERIVQRLD